jgi:hypothetical protein
MPGRHYGSNRTIDRLRWPRGIVLLAFVVSGCGRVEQSPTPPTLAPGPTGTATEPVLVTNAPEESVGPTPLNDLEQLVVAALADLGLEGWRAQLPFKNADMWVRIDDTRALFVSAYPRELDLGPSVVVSTRSVRGIQVEKLEPVGSVRDQYRFRCGGLPYWVGGDAPPPFANLDAFIDAFIDVLDCPPTG